MTYEQKDSVMTLRVEEPVHQELRYMSGLLHKSMNQIAANALKHELSRLRRREKSRLEKTLAKLQSYTRRDPDFFQAIEAFAQQEVSVREDPADGKVTSATGKSAEEQLKAILGNG